MPTHRSRLATLSFVLVVSACGDGRDRAEHDPARTAVEPAARGGAAADPAASEGFSWSLPRGLHEPPPVPDTNPMTVAKIDLGHRLFMEKRLSIDGSRSCYSCHQNELGNADGLALALGPGDKPLTRNTPTIWNVGYHKELYWDGRAGSLEQQAIGALKGGNMGLGDALDGKAREIGSLAEYAPKFRDVFAVEGDAVEADHIAAALAAYQRTLLCGDTVWDKDQATEDAKRGWQLFIGKASCITCHSGPNFSDGLYHDVGIGSSEGELADIGRAKVTNETADRGKFRTPTLRNASRTAPYFHDGSVATLVEAIRLMAGGGGIERRTRTLDPQLQDRGLTEAEVQDLVAFIRALDCPGKLEVIGDQRVAGIGSIAAPAEKG